MSTDANKPRLVEPSLDCEAAFVEMAREYHDGYEQAGRYRQAVEDFAAFVRRLQDEARGVHLPPGWVPSQTYWLLRADGAIVADSCLRQDPLTESLLRSGGHIGYGVRPSQRRKGYGRLICALTVEKARAAGMRRVLITCDADNAASARIIEANGGVLENEVIAAETGKLKRRYWVEIGQREEVRS